MTNWLCVKEQKLKTTYIENGIMKRAIEKKKELNETFEKNYKKKYGHILHYVVKCICQSHRT